MPKNRIERSDIEPIELHRSYGVTKKETWLTHLNSWLASVLAAKLLIGLSVVWILGLVLLIAMLGYLGILLAIIATALFVYFDFFVMFRKKLFYKN